MATTTDQTLPSEMLQAITRSVTRTISDTLSHEQLAQVTSLLNARHAYLTEVVDQETLRIIASWQDGQRGPTLDYCTLGTPCADVIRGGIRLIDGAIADRFPDNWFIQEHGFESYVGCPIVGARGQTLGHLCVYSDARLDDPDTATALVSLVAEQISSELQHLRGTRQLEEQKQHLQTLLANIPGMAYRCANDKNWTMEFVSAGCTELTGYDPSELESLRPTWAALIHDDDRDRVWKTVQLALAESNEFEIQYRIDTKSGQPKWVWERGRSVTSASGQVDVIEGFITDITPLKQSEFALAGSEALFEAIVSTADDGIVMIDAQGHIELFNKAAEDLFGYSTNEVVGENIRMLMPEPYRSKLDQYLGSYIEAGKTMIMGIRSEVTAQRKDGSIIPVHLSISEVALSGNRCFSGIVRDLSQQKAAEEALRQEHERLNVTFEHAPMGIVTYRFGETFISTNRAFCEITGYTVDQLMAMTLEDLTHPDDRAKSAAFAAKAQAGDIDRFSHSKRYIRRDGAVINVKVVNAITHDAAGKPDLVIGQVEDLTPRLRAEAEAREHRQQLAHADRLNTLGEMSTGIAHEINQPLTAISLFAQAGKRLYEAGNHERMEEIFDKLSQHAQRAGAVIERMQTMARRQESTKEITDCNALVLEIAKLAEAEARILDITIEVGACNNLPPVDVDIVQIQQVALNLLRNGMESMRAVDCRDGNAIKIRTKRRNNGDIEVAVVDTGCGVSEEVAAKLFTPFSTTKELGMGIGLSISRAIIIAHDGQLEFHNNESGGATFSFTLPTAAQGNQDG